MTDRLEVDCPFFAPNSEVTGRPVGGGGDEKEFAFTYKGELYSMYSMLLLLLLLLLLVLLFLLLSRPLLKLLLRLLKQVLL